MKNPWAPFPYYLAQAQTGYVAAPSMLNNPDGAPRTRSAPAPSSSRAGPPTATSPPPANPHYWRPGFPYLNHITFKPIINPDSRVEALETGDHRHDALQLARQPAEFRGNKKWSYFDNSGQVVGQPTVNCVMLNTSTRPFNNLTLRKAMAMASTHPSTPR